MTIGFEPLILDLNLLDELEEKMTAQDWDVEDLKMTQVRVELSAFTRLTFTKVVEVPDDVADDPEALQGIADEMYDDTDGGEWVADEHYWEKGTVKATRVEEGEFA